MTKHDQIIERLHSLIFSLGEVKSNLFDEQDESEGAHREWDDDESEDKGEEPEVVDNADEISNIDNAISSLEDAVDHLT